MKELRIDIPVLVKQEDELNESEKRLVDEAKAATKRSYAPYSHFCVGAACALDNGTIVSGSNQENAASPSGICAERTTMFYANSRYPDHSVEAICIAARDTTGAFTQRPVAPCGACRQVLVETEARYGKSMRVLLYGTEGTYIINSARELLPVSFDSSYL